MTATKSNAPTVSPEAFAGKRTKLAARALVAAAGDRSTAAALLRSKAAECEAFAKTATYADVLTPAGYRSAASEIRAAADILDGAGEG